MSETSILPGASPAADSNIDMVPPGTGFDDTEGGGDRRRLMIIGAVVGLLVVLAAAYLFLHKGSSSGDSTFVPHSTHAASPSTPSGSGKGSPAGSTKGGNSNSKPPSGKNPTTVPKKAQKPQKSQVRDPFKALITAPVTDGGGSTTTTTVDAPDPTQTTPSTGTGTETTPPSTGPTPTPSPSTSTKGHGTVSGSPLWVQLMKTKGDRAYFKVGYAGHKYRSYVVQAPKATSSQGTVFDKVFALIGIQNGQVTLQIGDDTPFDLTTGISHAV